MREERTGRFIRLYAGTGRMSAEGEAAGPGAHPMDSWCPPCPPPRRHGGTPIDAIVGLAIRIGLAAALWSWARSNALPVSDWGNWQTWFAPEPGFVSAVSVWLPGFADAAGAAFFLILAASLLPVALVAGLLTRLAGLTVILCAGFFALAIAPEGWTFALVAGALGIYLLLRGAGPLSVDWGAARLARMG
ncbi:hypothetical protein [Glycocaulis sp.]|uniref:hypothetical protein n=1 Tax=Glycocaulis sp. TaxID=1969725 RepID=UPI0025B7BA96|nr:hypothetical protein [Glycocaulis sp.]MCH8521590.1 hypothetical protein [Glycocaulis sp.]